MSKQDRVYFENLIDAADISYQAANYLLECLINYKIENIDAMLETMHKYEHAGDIKNHEMSAMLARAFVTPVDREDLEMISRNIDEVTDKIEEVLQRFYVDRITSVTPEAIEFAKTLISCTTTMKELAAEFANFKKPEKLHKMIIELNNYEEKCDALYLKATYDAHERFDNVLDIFFWREIYDKMEKCADACEHVGDCVGMVVMKNS